MFNIKTPNRVCLISDGYNAIKHLKASLKINKNQSKPDELENYINSIFSNNVETGAEIDDDEVDGGETVEVIHYYYIIQPSKTNKIQLIPPLQLDITLIAPLQLVTDR